MKPTDLRNATFATLRQGLSDRLKVVYDAWVIHGPATTRELSNRSGIDILSVRPRTTDLCDLGLVDLVGDERGTEGIYQAVHESKWNDWHQAQLIGQLQLI